MCVGGQTVAKSLAKLNHPSQAARLICSVVMKTTDANATANEEAAEYWQHPI